MTSRTALGCSPAALGEHVRRGVISLGFFELGVFSEKKALVHYWETLQVPWVCLNVTIWESLEVSWVCLKVNFYCFLQPVVHYVGDS